LSGSPYRSAPLQTRHRLVFEIGDEGVERLVRSAYAPGDGEAGEWAIAYLQRAGMSEARDGVSLELGPASTPLELTLAGDAFRGAFAAVEAIKRVLGVGTRGSIEDAHREVFERA
jgi:hypothetical protein